MGAETEAERAVDSLLRNGTGLGTRTNGVGSELRGDYLKAAAVAKNGLDVIVRLTADQALEFADMIMQNED